MKELLFYILQCFYFILPAYFANMAPVIVRKLFGFLAVPIDFGGKIGGRDIFGKNKTWRGLIFGIFFSIIITFFQFMLYNISFFESVSFVDYRNWIFLGFMIGLGALGGDLIKSFFKRRIGIKPGNKWPIIDQIDFVIGTIIVARLFFFFGYTFVLVTLTMSIILTITVNHISHYFGVREERW